MKKRVFTSLMLLFGVVILNAQSDYKVVFDLTSRDSLDHKAVLRWVGEVSKAAPDAKLEVVMYGQGVNMVARGRSVVAETVNKISQNKNVTFAVCAVALQNQGIDKSELLPNIQVVPDGIYEIILKQREGWGYIKAVH